MIDYPCKHCHGPMSSPESMIGKFEVCPACGRRMKVLDPAMVWQQSRCSDRQLAYAGSLGLAASDQMSGDEVSQMLTCFDRVKHYLYGMMIHLTGTTAAGLGIPRLDVEMLVARMVNANDPLAALAFEQVGPDESSSQFIKPQTDLYQRMLNVLLSEFGPSIVNKIRPADQEGEEC